MMEKAELSTRLRGILVDAFGTLKLAAGASGIPYDRLTKSIQRNTFSQRDLMLIANSIPHGAIKEDSFEAFTQKYSYTLSRQYSGGVVKSPRSQENSYEASLESLFIQFDALKRLARKDGELLPAVTELYENWHTEMTMVLFLHQNYVPFEWDIAAKATRMNMFTAVQKGGHVIYVFEDTDDLTGESHGPDNIDADFKRFISRMEREAGSEHKKIAGSISLLRVPHCVF